MHRSTPDTAKRARQLRRDQTDVERKLWFALRDRRFAGAKFRRQVPIGGYIADFCCLAQKLIVELDGGQHSERADDDDQRSRTLAAHGYRVVRFWNNDVTENLDGVLQRIEAALQKRSSSPPHPPLSPVGRGQKTRER